VFLCSVQILCIAEFAVEFPTLVSYIQKWFLLMIGLLCVKPMSRPCDLTVALDLL